jgi:O-antigen/teichoic acid export membrane protein
LTVQTPSEISAHRSPLGRIRQNLISLTVSQLSTFLLAVFTVAIVPKYLGPSTFGAFSAASAFLGLFVLAASLGSGTFLLKTLSRAPSQLGRYTFNALIMKVVLSVAMMGIAIGTSILLRYPAETQAVIAASAIGILLMALNDVCGASLQASGRMTRFAVWGAIQRYVGGLIGIGLVLTHHGVVEYALVVTCSYAISLVAYCRALWPDIRSHCRVELRLWRSIATGGLPYFFWNAILMVYGSIDILLLQRLTDTATVGWYSLAYAWIGIPVFFPTALVTSVLPSLSASAFHDHAGFTNTVNKALRLAVFVGTPMAIGIALVSADILRLFRYPASFSNAIPLMRILSVHIPIVAVDMILATALTAKDRQKAWVMVGVIAAVFNPAVNLYAIPATRQAYGNGAIGASVVTVATELVMMLGAIWLRPAGVLDRHTIFFMGRTLLAAVLMIPPVVMLGGAPLALKVFLGTVTFGLGALLFRLVTISGCRSGIAQMTSLLASRRSYSTIATSVGSS